MNRENTNFKRRFDPRIVNCNAKHNLILPKVRTITKSVRQGKSIDLDVENEKSQK